MKKLGAALLALAFVAGVALHDGTHPTAEAKTCCACGVGHAVQASGPAPRLAPPPAPAGETAREAAVKPDASVVRLFSCRGPPAA